MAKKKKASLKPVQRGFATTSTPKRVEAEEPEAVFEETNEAVTDQQQQDATGLNTNGTSAGEQGGAAAAEQNGAVSSAIVPEEKPDGPAPEDWETEERMTVEGVYQGYVERLQEKGEKEVGRILKQIDFDRRTGRGNVQLEVEDDVLDQVETLRGQRARDAACSGLTLAPDLSDPPTRERHLLRLYVTYRVLTRHGFSTQRVIECLEALKKEGYEAGGKDPLGKITWEEGMAWCYRHSSEGELRAVGE